MDGKKYGVDINSIKALKEFQLSLLMQRNLNLQEAEIEMEFSETCTIATVIGTTSSVTFTGATITVNTEGVSTIMFGPAEYHYKIDLKQRDSVEIQNNLVTVCFSNSGIQTFCLEFEDISKVNKFTESLPPLPQPGPDFESVDFTESSSEATSGHRGTERGNHPE